VNRIVVLVAAMMTLVLAASAPAAEKPRPPGQAEAKTLRLFESGGFTRLVEQRSATLEEVAAVAAVAESLDRPAALERVTGVASSEAFSTAAAVTCTWTEWQTSRGIFPYRRWIVGQTYWCYYPGGAITYRASNTAGRVDGVCSSSNARDWKVAGGAGYSWVIVHHEADFSCATPWWYRLNDTLWMEPGFNSYGNTWMTAAS
jgi:hypothetical protein